LAKEIVRLVKDRDNLSEHNRSLIKDLKETREQVAELYALNSGLRYAASEMEQRIKRLNELIKQGNITGVSIDIEELKSTPTGDLARYNHFSPQVYQSVWFYEIKIGEKFRSDKFKDGKRRKDIIMVKTGNLSYKELRSDKEYNLISSEFIVSSYDKQK
jgi:hypothetical protein